jgi:hypothetical protein
VRSSEPRRVRSSDSRAVRPSSRVSRAREGRACVFYRIGACAIFRTGACVFFRTGRVRSSDSPRVRYPETHRVRSTEGKRVRSTEAGGLEASPPAPGWIDGSRCRGRGHGVVLAALLGPCAISRISRREENPTGAQVRARVCYPERDVRVLPNRHRHDPPTDDRTQARPTVRDLPNLGVRVLPSRRNTYWSAPRRRGVCVIPSRACSESVT